MSSNQNEKTFLYPYYSIDLVVIFVYGHDYTRLMNLMLIPDSVLIVTGIIILYICVCAVILCIIRKKLGPRRNDLLSAFTDITIIFIGGGNVKIDHKWEKWFFSVLLIGSMFIMFLFGGDLLDSVYLILNQKITKFQELVKINAAVFPGPTLISHNDSIREMFR